MTRQYQRHRIFGLICVLGWLCLCANSTSWSQSVCLPLPRLLTTMPMGGMVGTEFDVVIAGENLEDTGELFFNHPGIVASPQRDEQGVVVPNHYQVAIAASCPSGIYEARVMSRLGISSARAFSVDQLAESIQKSPNTTLDTAMELNVNSICNGATTAKSIDHYFFHAKQGQRYVVHCLSRGIDSKLDPVVIVADATGRDLVVDRRGDTIDFVAEVDGKHIIKVHELTFKGGSPYFYRLVLRELQPAEPLPMFASTRTVSAFSWPPIGIADVAPHSEIEPNNDSREVQKITLPFDVTGSFFPAADVDCFEFEAKQGETWWIEVASERLGRPTDPSIIVQRVNKSEANEVVTDIAEFNDIPSPMKPSSNGYAYDGPPYDGGTLDLIGKLDIKENGFYRLQLTDLFGGTRNDDRNQYRLIIRQAAPDFALAAWGLHMELRNGDRNALSKPISLRAGGTIALEVVVVRRDGFDGDIDLSMSGLPPGVTAAGLKIPTGKSRGIMLITAAENAPFGFANASFVGTSTIDSQVAVRPVQMAQMAWPVPDAWGEIPSPRLVDGVPVSITESEIAPMSIVATEQKVWEVDSGATLTIPLTIIKRSDFSGTVIQLNTLGEGFERVPRFDIPLTADTADARIDLSALQTPPGDYQIAFFGPAVAKYRYDPHAILVAEASLREATGKATEAVAELDRIQALLASSSLEDHNRLEAESVSATTVKQAADNLVVQRTQELKAVNDRAAPKDTVDIVISEPIHIRVK